MHTVKIRYRKTSKAMQKLIAKAEREVDEEVSRQIDLVNCSMVIALWRYWNFRIERIAKIFTMQKDIWDECGADGNMSMIRKCDEECDIELTNHEGVSYRNIAWLNDVKETKPLNDYEWLVFRQNQKKWTKAQMLACICLTMHRAEGWGFKRLSELMNRMEDILDEFDYDQTKLINAAYEECKFDWLGEHREKAVG